MSYHKHVGLYVKCLLLFFRYNIIINFVQLEPNLNLTDLG
jgi:hypothetical protein